MTGQLIDEAINTIFWPDSELESVEIDYDAVNIRIQEPSGDLKLISCIGHIGYEHIGFWDEIVIESGNLYRNDELIDRYFASVKKRLGHTIPDSGNTARNSKCFFLLKITLIDGSELNIVTSGITTSKIR